MTLTLNHFKHFSSISIKLVINHLLYSNFALE